MATFVLIFFLHLDGHLELRKSSKHFVVKITQELYHCVRGLATAFVQLPFVQMGKPTSQTTPLKSKCLILFHKITFNCQCESAMSRSSIHTCPLYSHDAFSVPFRFASSSLHSFSTWLRFHNQRSSQERIANSFWNTNRSCRRNRYNRPMRLLHKQESSGTQCVSGSVAGFDGLKQHVFGGSEYGRIRSVTSVFVNLKFKLGDRNI